MFSIKQLKDFMEKKLGVTNDTAKLAEESVLLYLEELDEQIVPPTIHDFLPDPIVFQTYSFMDESEWIIGIALEAETNNPLFLVCLRDGKRVFQEL